MKLESETSQMIVGAVLVLVGVTFGSAITLAIQKVGETGGLTLTKNKHPAKVFDRMDGS